MSAFTDESAIATFLFEQFGVETAVYTSDCAWFDGPIPETVARALQTRWPVDRIGEDILQLTVGGSSVFTYRSVRPRTAAILVIRAALAGTIDPDADDVLNAVLDAADLAQATIEVPADGLAASPAEDVAATLICDKACALDMPTYAGAFEEVCRVIAELGGLAQVLDTSAALSRSGR